MLLEHGFYKLLFVGKLSLNHPLLCLFLYSDIVCLESFSSFSYFSPYSASKEDLRQLTHSFVFTGMLLYKCLQVDRRGCGSHSLSSGTLATSPLALSGLCPEVLAVVPFTFLRGFC